MYHLSPHPSFLDWERKVKWSLNSFQTRLVKRRKPEESDASNIVWGNREQVISGGTPTKIQTESSERNGISHWTKQNRSKPPVAVRTAGGLVFFAFVRYAESFSSGKGKKPENQNLFLIFARSRRKSPADPWIVPSAIYRKLTMRKWKKVLQNANRSSMIG